MRAALVVILMLIRSSGAFAELSLKLCGNGFDIKARFFEDGNGIITCSLRDNYVEAKLQCKKIEAGEGLSDMVCKGNWEPFGHDNGVPVILNLTPVNISKGSSNLVASFVRHPNYTGLPVGIVCE